MRSRSEMEAAVARLNCTHGTDLRIEWCGPRGCLTAGRNAELLTLSPLALDSELSPWLAGFENGVRFGSRLCRNTPAEAPPVEAGAGRELPGAVRAARDDLLRTIRGALEYSETYAAPPGVLVLAGFQVVADVVPWADTNGLSVSEDNGCGVFERRP